MREIELLNAPPEKVYVPILNYGIWSKRNLSWLFDIRISFFRFPRKSFDSQISIGWGRKKSGIRASKSVSKGHKCWLIEDGFIRSYGSAFNFPSLAFVVDELGIYYDSNSESTLDKALSSDNDIFEDYGSMPNKALKLIIENKLSKYNSALPILFESSQLKYNKKILLVDQTYGDMSVKYGGASPQSFLDMLNAALIENPLASIYVKTHPEVTSGRKKGYLTHIQDTDRIVMIREDVNPIDLIQQMDKVYVVTSQMGFEALMCGKPVICFGVPWYAGWGVTDDRVQDSPAWARRTKKRSVDELFAAAYLHYTRYLNPFTHERGSILDVIEWLILQKQMTQQPFARSGLAANIKSVSVS